MYNYSYLGYGGSTKSIALSFRIGKSTMNEIVSETCKVLTSVLKPLYMALPNKQKWLEIAADYERMWNFPNCLGSLDGKHIQIKCPPNEGSRFWNYLKYNSIVLLATCDAHNRFTWYNVGDFSKKIKISILHTFLFCYAYITN